MIRLAIFLFALVRKVQPLLSTRSELQNIGTNDKAFGVDKDEFLQHYQSFLVRLRDSHPGTLKRIYVIVSSNIPDKICTYRLIIF